MYEHGTVVVASDPFGNTPKRPYIVCSDETHPFAGEQYVALGITTKAYEDSIPLSGTFVAGSLTRESFLSPWAIVSILERHIDRAVARIAEGTVTEALQRTAGYVGLR